MLAKPKVLLAPMNMAAMPVTIVRALRDAGFEAAHIQYTTGGDNPLKYDLDRRADYNKDGGRIGAQFKTLREALAEDFDIYHFWNRSLTFRLDYGGMSGIDLPLIKARGKRIAHRFTGFDLRLPSRDLALNPHSPFRYGQKPLYDEKLVAAYQDFLGEYVDAFMVQDPEMAQFRPDAEIIPRALDLTRWTYAGVQRKERPLLVHAPTNPAAKGTRFILAAIEALRDEGLAFDFKLLRGLPHADAQRIYADADIIIDQILIGATGVLTLEAWALGKPVVVNLRPDLFEPFYETNDLPVINANPETIKDQLRRAIKDVDLRLELAPRGRALVEAKHDITQVISHYADFYERLYRQKPSAPGGLGDVAYIEMQVALAEHNERFWPRWRARYRRVMDRARDVNTFRADGRPAGELAKSIAAAWAAIRLFAHDYVAFWRIILRRLKIIR